MEREQFGFNKIFTQNIHEKKIYPVSLASNMPIVKFDDYVLYILRAIHNLMAEILAYPEK